jgi:hypothetical protein
MLVRSFWRFGRDCSRFEIYSIIFEVWLIRKSIFFEMNWSDYWTVLNFESYLKIISSSISVSFPKYYCKLLLNSLNNKECELYKWID